MTQELKKKEKELLWELKQVCKNTLRISIPFERMLSDVSYRHDVLHKLKSYQHPDVERILRRWERLQPQPVTADENTEAELLPPVLANPGRRYQRWLIILLALVLGFSTAFWWSQSGLSRWLFPTPETADSLENSLPALPVDNPQVVLEISADQTLVPAATAFSSTFWQQSSPVLKEAPRPLPPNDQQWQALLAEQGVVAINLRLPPRQVPAWRLLEQGIVNLLWSQHDLLLKDNAMRLPLGIQGLALVVARGNALTTLDYADLEKILSGQHRDWQSLPESKIRGEIQLIALKNSLDHQQNLPPLAASLAVNEQTSLTAALTSIADDVRSLGLVPFTPQLDEQIADQPLRILALRSQSTGPNTGKSTSKNNSLSYTPSAFSLLSGDYPLRRPVWLYRNAAAGEYGQRYQALLEKNPDFLVDYGYFSPKALWQSGSALFADITSLPQDYQSVVKNGQRLSYTLSENDLSNSQTLEKHSRTIIEILRQHPDYKGEVIVVGLSNPSDSNAFRQARERAQQVSRQLLRLGALPAEIVTVADLPRSPNPAENNRVEIWLAN